MQQSSAQVVGLLGLLSGAGGYSCMGRAMRHTQSLPKNMLPGRWHILEFGDACRHLLFQDGMQRRYTKSAGCAGNESKTSKLVLLYNRENLRYSHSRSSISPLDSKFLALSII